MKLKTHTFYELNGSIKIDSRKLKPETLIKRGVKKAYYADIDRHAPSKGYFNHRPCLL